MHLVRFGKVEKRLISLSCSFFLICGAVFTAPFSIREIKGAEIGLVGALAGETTLWEIFGTLLAGAGAIIVNESIQNEAMNNLASNSYSLDYLVQNGMIEVPEGNLAENPESWDWSGLEDKLRDDELNETWSADEKIIFGVFSQNGGSGSGGDEDPWYKKFVRWVKAGVSQGAYNLSQYINTGSGQLELGLASIATMFGLFADDAVVPGNLIYQSVDGDMITSPIGIYNIYNYGKNATKNRWDFSNNYGIKVVFSLGKTGNYNYLYICGYNPTGSRIGVDFSKTEDYYNGEQSTFNAKVYFTAGSSQAATCVHGSSSHPNLYVEVYGNVPCFSSTSKALEYLNTFRNSSPDVMTPTGPATASGGAWVPTPYIDDNEHLEIVPQTQINEYITYIYGNDNLPSAEGIGTEYESIIGDFVEGGAIPQPTPMPQITTVPRPEQNPNVTPIPDVDPGGNDNPITVTEPDPMPVIEGGNADLPQIWEFFPFCIPNDIVKIYELFEVDENQRMAPSISWRFYVEDMGIDYTFNLDLSAYNSAAEVFRKLFLLLFIASLLIGTRNLIWR